MLKFVPIERKYAEELLRWQYEPPYDFYNIRPDQFERGVELLSEPDFNYYAVLDEQDKLVAYCGFGPDAQVAGGFYDPVGLDIGLGVRPDLTGQGKGHVFTTAVTEFALRTFQPVYCRVTIAAFNIRAQRAWERAGYSRTREFRRKRDGESFVMLERRVDDPEG